MTLVFIVLLVLVLLRVPIFIAFLSSTFLYFLVHPDLFKVIWIQRFYGGIENVPLLAIPFFVMTGVCLNYTGITNRLMHFSEVLVGHKKGGLAHVNILLSTFLGGVSGSSLADAAMQSKLLVPEMEKRGYPRPFSAVVTAFSSQITPIIPPGIALIIYGSVSNTSIGKLFLAGYLPGILLCVTMLAIASYTSHKNGYKPSRNRKASIKEILISFKGAYIAILLPILIILGMRSGIMTPSEVGAVAVVLILLFGLLDYKKMKKEDLIKIFLETVVISGSIMLIIGSASIFSYIMTWERVPQKIAEMILPNINSKFTFLFYTNLFLLIAGMFVEGNSLMIILIPILMPLANHFGIDNVHFGILLIFNLAIGSLTPPVGTVMFTVCSITKVSTLDFLKSSGLFYLVIFLCLALITYVPTVSVLLPNLIY